MKEFRFIVKVDHSNPIKSLQKLGELVCEDQKAFDDVDVDFVQKQDFIVAVPVELSLTTELRAHLLYSNPDCRFVITGVPTHRLSNLLEFGFKIYDTVKIELNVEDEEEADKEEVPVEKKEEEVPVEKKEEQKFWVNGKEVDKKEFDAEVEKFKKSIGETGFYLPLLNKLFRL